MVSEIDWTTLKHDTSGATRYTCPECGEVVHPSWKDELCRVRVARALDAALCRGGGWLLTYSTPSGPKNAEGTTLAEACARALVDLGRCAGAEVPDAR